MAVYKGREGSISIGVTPGTSLGELRSFEFTTTANLVDASRMGDQWTRDEATQNTWTGSAELWFDDADAGQNLLVVGSRVTVRFFPKGSTVAPTDIIFSGDAVISEVGHKQAHDGLVERTVSLKGYGALIQATI